MIHPSTIQIFADDDRRFFGGNRIVRQNADIEDGIFKIE